MMDDTLRKDVDEHRDFAKRLVTAKTSAKLSP